MQAGALTKDHLDAVGWLGMAIWELVGRHNASSLATTVASKLLLDEFRESGDAPNAAIIESWFMTEDPNRNDLAKSAFQWARSGFPRIRVEAKSAASQCFTHISADMAEEVRWPWDAFVIELPPEILHYDHREGLSEEEVGQMNAVSGAALEGWATEILFARLGNPTSPDIFHCNIMAGAALLAQSRQTLGGLVTGILSEFSAVVRKNESFSESDESAMTRANRIMASLCLRLTHGRDDGVNFHEVKQPKSIVSKFRPKVPQKLFIFADDVEVDFRAHARDTAGQKAVTWKSRWPVRGHFRNQAVGQGRKERRGTWVRPHWKGPDEMPARIRDHVLNER
jgi:hypothetical protein